MVEEDPYRKFSEEEMFLDNVRLLHTYTEPVDATIQVSLAGA